MPAGFDDWKNIQDYPTLFSVDRDVLIDTTTQFPPCGARKDTLPLWIKAGGAVLEPLMPARQHAWIRRADGGWLAVVTITLCSGNGQSRAVVEMLVPGEALRQPD